MRRAARLTNWEKLSDEQILQMRVRDLGLQIEGSSIEPLVSRLYKELDDKGISFHPPCYLADEWLCPDRIPIIGIPFFLAHPRLKRIERKMMAEVEGGTEKYFMKLIRHECGHALNYAYELYRKTRWRQLFGPFSSKYSDSYYCQPYSRRFVIHLAHAREPVAGEIPKLARRQKAKIYQQVNAKHQQPQTSNHRSGESPMVGLTDEVTPLNLL